MYPKGLVKTTLEEDLNLGRLAKNGDKKARDELIVRHIPLCMHLSKRYTSSFQRDDLIEYGMIGLCMAADRYDPNRGIKFGSFARFYIKLYIRDAIQNFSKIVRIPRSVFRNESPSTWKDCCQWKDEIERFQKPEKESLDVSLETLDERTRHYIERKFFDGLTCQQISNESEIPRTTVNWRINKGLAMLKRTLST